MEMSARKHKTAKQGKAEKEAIYSTMQTHPSGCMYLQCNHSQNSLRKKKK